MFIYFSLLFMFTVGVFCFFLINIHVLLSLLTLEFLSLIILLMVVNFVIMYVYDSMVMIYLIIVMVCEAVMGLVLLTLMVRTHGGDYLKSFSMLKC